MPGVGRLQLQQHFKRDGPRRGQQIDKQSGRHAPMVGAGGFPLPQETGQQERAICPSRLGTPESDTTADDCAISILIHESLVRQRHQPRFYI